MASVAGGRRVAPHAAVSAVESHDTWAVHPTSNAPMAVPGAVDDTEGRMDSVPITSAQHEAADRGLVLMAAWGSVNQHDDSMLDHLASQKIPAMHNQHLDTGYSVYGHRPRASSGSRAKYALSPTMEEGGAGGGSPHALSAVVQMAAAKTGVGARRAKIDADVQPQGPMEVERVFPVGRSRMKRSKSETDLLLPEFAKRRQDPKSAKSRWANVKKAVMEVNAGGAKLFASNPNNALAQMAKFVTLELREPHHVALGMVIDNMLKCLLIAIVSSIVPTIVIVAFSFTFLQTVREWQEAGLEIISSNLIEAWVIGEPFHALKPSTLVQNLIWFCIVCPFACCLFKLAGHLSILYDLKDRRRVYRIAAYFVGAMGIMQSGCFLPSVAVVGGVKVPRLVWMSMIFALLFLGIHYVGEEAARQVGDPTVGRRFLRQTILVNCICYIYSLFGPWMFFHIGRLPQILVLTLVHPALEYAMYFMYLSDSAHMRSANSRRLFLPCIHYTGILRMFETFLALNLETTTDTVLALVITKLLQIIMRVYSNGIYRVLRRPSLDWDTFFGEKWFVLFSLDYDRAIFISDQACTILSSVITLALRFDGHTDVGDVLARCFSALIIDWLKDLTVSYTLLQLGADWYKTFQTRTNGYLAIVAGAVNASSLMFLFYIYSFLASRCTLD